MRWNPLIPSLLLGSCLLWLNGCKSMTPGQLDRVQPTSEAPLAGNVYLLRGFIGIWSYGVDHLGQKINNAGIRASVYQEDQWQSLSDRIVERYHNVPDHEPLVLIGHSYGADDAIRIARQLDEHKIPVDLIITLDPVTPPKVPANVRLCYNIYQSSFLDTLPFFRGVPLESQKPDGSNLQNVNIRTDRRDLLESDTDHFNIEKNVKIHAEVIAKLKEVCVPRDVWATHRQATRYTSAADPRGSSHQASPNTVSRDLGAANDMDRVP